MGLVEERALAFLKGDASATAFLSSFKSEDALGATPRINIAMARIEEDGIAPRSQSASGIGGNGADNIVEECYAELQRRLAKLFVDTAVEVATMACKFLIEQTRKLFIYLNSRGGQVTKEIVNETCNEIGNKCEDLVKKQKN